MPPPDVDQYVTITPYIALLHEGHLRSPSTPHVRRKQRVHCQAEKQPTYGQRMNGRRPNQSLAHLRPHGPRPTDVCRIVL